MQNISSMTALGATLCVCFRINAMWTDKIINSLRCLSFLKKGVPRNIMMLNSNFTECFQVNYIYMSALLRLSCHSLISIHLSILFQRWNHCCWYMASTETCHHFQKVFMSSFPTNASSDFIHDTCRLALTWHHLYHLAGAILVLNCNNVNLWVLKLWRWWLCWCGTGKGSV
jgi:hypothetical protein